MAKNIAKKESGPMTFSDEKPKYIKENVNRGNDNVQMDDLTIPRLDVLQDLSPQRKKSDPAYIEGAEEGMLYNTVTQKLYGTESYFIPCFYRKEWLIWKLQNAGGGLNGVFTSEAEAKAEFAEKKFGDVMFEDKGQMVCAYEIVDTANHFGLTFTDENSVEEICVSMSKSKMKVNRTFNTVIRMAGGDRFSRVYRISSVVDTNQANQKYYNIKLQSMGYTPEDLYVLAEKMYESISASDRKANYGTEQSVETKEINDDEF